MGSAFPVWHTEHIPWLGFQKYLEEKRLPEMLSCEKRRVRNFLLHLRLGHSMLSYYLGRSAEESLGMSYHYQEVEREVVSLPLYSAGGKRFLQYLLLRGCI